MELCVICRVFFSRKVAKSQSRKVAKSRSREVAKSRRRDGAKVEVSMSDMAVYVESRIVFFSSYACKVDMAGKTTVDPEQWTLEIGHWTFTP